MDAHHVVLAFLFGGLGLITSTANAEVRGGAAGNCATRPPVTCSLNPIKTRLTINANGEAMWLRASRGWTRVGDTYRPKLGSGLRLKNGSGMNIPLPVRARDVQVNCTGGGLSIELGHPINRATDNFNDVVGDSLSAETGLPLEMHLDGGSIEAGMMYGEDIAASSWGSDLPVAGCEPYFFFRANGATASASSGDFSVGNNTGDMAVLVNPFDPATVLRVNAPELGGAALGFSNEGNLHWSSVDEMLWGPQKRDRSKAYMKGHFYSRVDVSIPIPETPFAVGVTGSTMLSFGDRSLAGIPDDFDRLDFSDVSMAASLEDLSLELKAISISLGRATVVLDDQQLSFHAFHGSPSFGSIAEPYLQESTTRGGIIAERVLSAFEGYQLEARGWFNMAPSQGAFALELRGKSRLCGVETTIHVSSEYPYISVEGSDDCGIVDAVLGAVCQPGAVAECRAALTTTNLQQRCMDTSCSRCDTSRTPEACRLFACDVACGFAGGMDDAAASLTFACDALEAVCDDVSMPTDVPVADEPSAETSLVQGIYAFSGRLYQGCYADSWAPWGSPLVPDNNWAWNWEPAYVPSSFDTPDAAFYRNGSFYFIEGAQFIERRVGESALEGGSSPVRPLRELIPNWPAHWTHVDAAVTHDNGAVYFFRGEHYLRFDPAAGVIHSWYVEADRRISGNFAWAWPNWSSVDAAVNDGSGHIYFVRGNQTAIYDMATNGTTTHNWPITCNVYGGVSALVSR